MIKNELTLEDKMLIRAYNLFYSKRLDLTDNYLEPKIQYMTFLLSKYGIHLTPKLHENITYVLDDTVHSEQITEWIKNLSSKELKELDKEVLIEWAKNKIKIIASNLKIYLKQYENNLKLEMFNNLCKVLYTSQMFIGYDFTSETISKDDNIDFPKDEIEQHVGLIKTIDKKLIEKGYLC